MNDRELKIHVDETFHDDFVAMARIMGFDNKSQYMRSILERELYGVISQVQVTLPGYGALGQNKTQTGSK